ncbi:TPA: abortive infection family protein [Pseudomonas aeruginosa]|nr:abortive infection family protein [Pseudomonas aeruginosa]
MDMDLLLHEVLRKINSGVTSFKPESFSPEDLKKFQPFAKAIVHAHALGYIEKMIPHREYHSGAEHYDIILVRGGLTHEGVLQLQVFSGQPTPADEILTNLLEGISSHSIRESWEKALNRRSTDPRGAITAARALLEATLKWIIEQRGGSVTDKNNELFNRAISALGLDLKGKPLEKTIQGLNAIIWSVGDMRNRHGDAHGAASCDNSPTKNEAGFCVNLASAAALYLLEEFESSHCFCSKAEG